MNFSPGGQPICIDSGASCCISNNRKDFVSFSPSSNSVLNGIANGLQKEGTGTLYWKIFNDNGDEVMLHIHNSLYVPSLPMKLLSPQQICQQTNYPDDDFIVHASHGTLRFASHQRTIYYNPINNLPIFFTSSNPSELSSTSSENSSITPATSALLRSANLDTCSPLSGPQCHLLLKHQQLGQLHMACVQQLARDGIFGPSYKAIMHCDLPLCHACLQGKQHERAATPVTASGTIDTTHLVPGMCISGDQLESTMPGLVASFQGSLSAHSYPAGTLFIYHASRYFFFTRHHSTGAEEAVAAKHRFELHAMSFNRSIQCYHTDNGIFRKKTLSGFLFHSWSRH